jgi:hypothetical protein
MMAVLLCDNVRQRWYATPRVLNTVSATTPYRLLTPADGLARRVLPNIDAASMPDRCSVAAAREFHYDPILIGHVVVEGTNAITRRARVAGELPAAVWPKLMSAADRAGAERCDTTPPQFFHHLESSRSSSGVVCVCVRVNDVPR